VLPKPTKPPFVSFGSQPDRHFEEKKETIIPESLWCNPHHQGTPEARAESLRVIELAQRGEPI
ncbi:MAG: hypothetical protein WCO89_12185, partial [Syntrophus sp. (in: bacteria)]